MLDIVLVVVLVCAALGVLAWAAFGGAALIRNVLAILGLMWEAITAIPAVIRVARRRITGGRAP